MKARGKIDSDHGTSDFIDTVNGLGIVSGYRRRKSRSEQGVDQNIAVLKKCLSLSPGRVEVDRRFSRATNELLIHCCRIAAQLGDGCQDEHAHVGMASTEEAGSDESISPIVALAAHNGDRLAPHGSQPMLKTRYDAGPGTFHQRRRRDMSL